MVQKVHKYADGGKVTKQERNFGAPIGGTPAPGSTTRQRPKVGDKSSDTRLLNPKKRTPSKPAPKKTSGGSVRRDYRGVNGVVDDAVKGK